MKFVVSSKELSFMYEDSRQRLETFMDFRAMKLLLHFEQPKFLALSPSREALVLMNSWFKWGKDFYSDKSVIRLI